MQSHYADGPLMYRLYDFARSGNCYKLRLAMAQLRLEFERVPIDILKGETRSKEFLRINPAGKIPVLETPEGHWLAESNAALWYLAADTPLWPASRLDQAQALQWMFFEQYNHEPYIATLRYWIDILKIEDDRAAQIDDKRQKGYAALDIMEGHLSDNRFFVAEQYSIADIALYAYTHVAHEGGFVLKNYPAIKAWLSRIEESDNYVSIRQ